MYLLQNKSAGFLGNSPLWWQKGGNGYTDNIDNAQEFTYEEASTRINSTKSTHNFVMWDAALVRSKSYRIVDAQHLK
jgi:uncharacterized protein (UPF0333 family)